MYTELQDMQSERDLWQNKFESQEQASTAVTLRLESQLRYLESETVSAPVLPTVLYKRSISQESLQSEVDLYRARCEELTSQLDDVINSLELSQAKFNNLEYETAETIERLEAQKREQDCASHILRISISLCSCYAYAYSRHQCHACRTQQARK